MTDTNAPTANHQAIHAWHVRPGTFPQWDGARWDEFLAYLAAHDGHEVRVAVMENMPTPNGPIKVYRLYCAQCAEVVVEPVEAKP